MTFKIDENEQYLNELDSYIGDGEHGSNLKRVFRLLVENLDSLSNFPPEEALIKAGTIVIQAGGGSGPTFIGFFIRTVGEGLKENSDLKKPQRIARSFEKGLDFVKSKGGASIGSKTLVDALEPAVKILKHDIDHNKTVIEALGDAVLAAKTGMESTRDMVAKKGRSLYVGERAIGYQDPGATAVYLLLQTIHETIQMNV